MMIHTNEESSYLKYWDVNSLCGWTMSQTYPLGSFKWVEETSQFNEVFINSYDEDSDIEYFFEVDFQYLEKLYEVDNYLYF